MQTYTYACTYTHACTHARYTHMRACTYTLTLPHMHAHTHARMRTCARTHACTHTHTHARTHTHTHYNGYLTSPTDLGQPLYNASFSRSFMNYHKHTHTESRVGTFSSTLYPSPLHYQSSCQQQMIYDQNGPSVTTLTANLLTVLQAYIVSLPASLHAAVSPVN